MVSMNKIQSGLTRYLDEEIIDKLSGYQRWIFTAAAGIYVADMPNLLAKVCELPAVKMLDIIDGDKVDIEKLYRHLKPAAQKNPAAIPLPMIGSITLTEADVDKIYNYIMSA